MAKIFNFFKTISFRIVHEQLWKWKSTLSSVVFLLVFYSVFQRWKIGSFLWYGLIGNSGKWRMGQPWRNPKFSNLQEKQFRHFLRLSRNYTTHENTLPYKIIAKYPTHNNVVYFYSLKIFVAVTNEPQIYNLFIRCILINILIWNSFQNNVFWSIALI